MINFDHAAEVALLLLAAYLCGCTLGYGAHLALRRITARSPAIAVSPPEASGSRLAAPTPPRSAARRLAGASARDDTAPRPVQMAQPPAVRRPPELLAPRRGRPDKLSTIKGIGPKTESALYDLGIYHFDQIAAWHAAHVDWLEGRIAVRGRIRREQWVEQATLLATAPQDVSPALKAG